MRIRIGNISYQGLNCDKRLIIPVVIEESKTPCVEKASAIMDMYEISYFVARTNPVLTGLLLLSAEVYAIDRAVSRHIDSIDGWSRIFDVTFKVRSADLFEANKGHIDSMLSFLTGDYWDCHFEEISDIEWGTDNKGRDDFSLISQVNLFSGGMDSLIGAIDFMEQNDEYHKLFLASHYDSFMGGPKSDQRKIVEKFSAQYPNKYIYLSPERITPGISKEKTCRSRSLMFLAIAILVAAYKSNKVIIPENGPVSLNFPLSPSRRAACSTRTTHPIFIQMMRDLLSCWEIPVEINNPYEFKTKGEMVRECRNLNYLLRIVSLSNSCGKRGEHQLMIDNPYATHCGRCMPCMYRKAALVGYDDPTAYGFTMQTLFHQPRNHKINNDFYAMLNYLRTDLSDEYISKELEIMGLRKSNPHFSDYVDLVKRTRVELKYLLRNEATDDILTYAGLL